MSRSKWKGSYLQKSLLIDFLKAKNMNKKDIYTYSRKSIIIPLFVGFTFHVHNGKSFIKVNVTKEMLGFKLGEFSPTRKKFSCRKQKKVYGTKN